MQLWIKINTDDEILEPKYISCVSGIEIDSTIDLKYINNNFHKNILVIQKTKSTDQLTLIEEIKKLHSDLSNVLMMNQCFKVQFTPECIQTIPEIKKIFMVKVALEFPTIGVYSFHLACNSGADFLYMKYEKDKANEYFKLYSTIRNENLYPIRLVNENMDDCSCADITILNSSQLKSLFRSNI